ncbi:MAG: thioredoxin family protein, partial [Planctomycetes bacterium]|nr:thioredoxin family protein [Planctomycetota bacterium]
MVTTMKTFFTWFASLLFFASVLTATSHAQSPNDGQGVDASPAVTVHAEFFVNEKSRNGELSVTASLRDGYHIYAMTQPKPFLATKIHVKPSDQVKVSESFTPARPPLMLRHESIDVDLHEYEGSITWTAPLRLTGDVDLRTVEISGEIFAQACDARGCLPPKKYAFTAEFKPAPVTAAASIAFREPISKEAATPVDAPRAAPTAKGATQLDFDKIETAGGASKQLPLSIVLAMAFAAGFILNFMPCVLPVIGLKIMAFAQQAGDRRGRIFTLNLWYSLGLISVFLVLATLAAFLGLGWGQQFSSVTFNVILAAVVFAFGLSFLGVWEIPIPGFVGSGGTSHLAQREGAAGAFSKGVLTTVLATPCSGPLLGSALTWAVTQPPLFTYLVFAFVGLGMASPYLLVGTFPRLIAFLPKPGEWMNTFKHIMGFVLLATVAYLLSFMPIPYVMPTVTFMIGLGAACWWIGQVPLTANLDKKVSNWIQATAVAVVVGFVSFGWLQGVMTDRFERAVDRELAVRNVALGASTPRGPQAGRERPWQPYSHDLLAQYTAAGKTVFVDFTADWCLTCKANEAVAINHAETRRFIADNGIITLKADKTQPAPEVDALLRKLGNKAGSIPFYAVFPAANPNRPILLDGMFTSPLPILNALRKA